MPTGTRFRLFPQTPLASPGQQPETVHVSSPPGSVGPGPSDQRMYVIDPIGEKPPYGFNVTAYGTPYLYFPPWTGPVGIPTLPGPDGHFDHLEPATRDFEAAHLFGCVRFTLDVRERYFGRAIPWYFRPRYERLEISYLPAFDNAQAGFGFLEVGHFETDDGARVPFSLNFDIIAHEVGHLVLFAETAPLGHPAGPGEAPGFHEATADLVALLAAAHLRSVIDPLLERTRGNLYALNRLNRIGEVTENDQVRLAANKEHLARFAAGWYEEHALSLPLTGAVFDILVDVFHELLLEHRLISPALEDLADQVEQQPASEPLIQALFDQAYGRDPAGFRDALIDARDQVGVRLAGGWSMLRPTELSFVGQADALVAVDRELGGRYQGLIRRNLALRGIGSVRVGPRLSPPAADSHAHSARRLIPDDAEALAPMSYRERWQLAQGGVCLPES